MLAAVLYTGCDCTYAMCAAERNGDHDTWRWFSFLLYKAVRSLCTLDEEAPDCYSGMMDEFVFCLSFISLHECSRTTPQSHLRASATRRTFKKARDSL